MDLVKKVAAQRERRDNALKRCEIVEARNKESEGLLNAKTEEVATLEERVRLTRQLIRIAQRLGPVREKAKQEEDKLRVMNERADKASARLEGVRRTCDEFEAKYEETRKKMRQLEDELSELSLG